MSQEDSQDDIEVENSKIKPGTVLYLSEIEANANENTTIRTIGKIVDIFGKLVLIEYQNYYIIIDIKNLDNNSTSPSKQSVYQFIGNLTLILNDNQKKFFNESCKLYGKDKIIPFILDAILYRNINSMHLKTYEDSVRYKRVFLNEKIGVVQQSNIDYNNEKQEEEGW
ncbi:hypothetical protein DLAC_11218 [Tieghemostelium lacteum]|uniref:Uncharacterized protein n=1 Tax=Tieghemostelium lacteum TaxID=361077 RepID=A0A151Z3G3_TIELA|nr:hypothetical protein DLAC_11218 [Tieghemostelium lacteum]|eukprot:KYQ88502.1 hypothetical protein DLAC_11218 [Tieghemostelium lacteum]